MDNVVNLYGGKDPRELPFYTLTDVATYLHVPRSTIGAWCGHKTYSLVEGRRKQMKPMFPIDAQSRRLTFHNLVEIYVVSSLTRTFRIPLPQLRVALDRLRTTRPLLDHVFYASEGEMFVEAADKVLVDIYSSPGQIVIRKLLESSIKRIDFDDVTRRPHRIHPWRESVEEAKVVSIDARRAFGRPTVVDRSLKVEVVIDLHRSGESVESLASNYDLDEDMVRKVLKWGGRETTAAA